MEEPLSATAQSTSRLADVSLLTEVIASSSKVPLEQIAKPTSQEYLSNLTTLGLQELLAEPTTLQTQSHHLTSSLTSLTHTSYPTFLSLHQTTNALTTSLSSLSSSLDSLLTSSLPALEECAAGWKDRTESVLKERSKARMVLEQHEKIRDLLEIPLLIDTCVRNGYFAEALSLVSHAKSLAANASSSNKPPPLLLSSVLSEIHHSIIQMLLSLLTTLYEPNRKLPALYKAVNFLRKMDVFGPSSPFASAPAHLNLNPKTLVQPSPPTLDGDLIGDAISSEEQIALAFLVGRESCLKSILEPCGNDVARMTHHGDLDDREKEDLARYLKKYVDLWREGVYDVITQYTTIFLEKTSPAAIALQGGATTKVNQAKSPKSPAFATSVSAGDEQQWIRLHTLITTYASRALTTHLVPVLSPSLPLLSMSLLPSLLTQLTYCSTAFARVGLDFRGILSALFSHAVLEVVSHDMRLAKDKFVARFQIPSGSAAASGTSSMARSISTSSTGRGSTTTKWEQPSKWLANPSAGAALPPVPITPATPLSAPPFLSQGPAHIPPQILASYPPLAEYTNALLGVLNGLRLLAPTGIMAALARVLDDEVLFKSGEALLAYIKAFCNQFQAAANGVQGPVQSTSVDDPEPDEEQEKEHQRRVIMAFGQVFFKVLVPFMRRALVEGVYDTKLDATFKGGELLPSVVMDWEDYALENEEEESSEEEDGEEESEEEES